MVTSTAERDMVLAHAHLGNAEDPQQSVAHHVDSDAMLADVESRYKWSNMKLDIDDWVC